MATLPELLKKTVEMDASGLPLVVSAYSIFPGVLRTLTVAVRPSL